MLDISMTVRYDSGKDKKNIIIENFTKSVWRVTGETVVFLEC